MPSGSSRCSTRTRMQDPSLVGCGQPTSPVLRAELSEPDATDRRRRWVRVRCMVSTIRSLRSLLDHLRVESADRADATRSAGADQGGLDVGLEDLADLRPRQVGPDLDLLGRLHAADALLHEGGELVAG